MSNDLQLKINVQRNNYGGPFLLIKLCRPTWCFIYAQLTFVHASTTACKIDTTALSRHFRLLPPLLHLLLLLLPFFFFLLLFFYYMFSSHRQIWCPTSPRLTRLGLFFELSYSPVIIQSNLISLVLPLLRLPLAFPLTTVLNSKYTLCMWPIHFHCLSLIVCSISSSSSIIVITSSSDFRHSSPGALQSI